MHAQSILCPLPAATEVFYGGEGRLPVAGLRLSSELGGYFAPAVKERGEAYFGHGAVRIRSADAHRVDAAVSGELRYRTGIEFHDGFVGLSCSCPFFTSRGLPCKHLWALLLTLDRRPETVHMTPRPRLSLFHSASGPSRATRKILTARLSFGYGDYIIDESDPEGAVYFRSDNVIVNRSRAAESDALTTLRSEGFRSHFDRESGRIEELTLRADRLPAVVEKLLAGGWYIEAEGKALRRAKSASFRVSSGIDWFEVGGELDFDEERASYPEVLRALRHGGNLVPLGDGSFGVLPAEWLRTLRLTAELGEPASAGIRFRPSQAALIEMLLRERGAVSQDEPFRLLRERLDHFSHLSAADPPSGFRGTLREYQKRGLAWLRFLDETGFGGCLADEMGLGKTVQVLSLLSGRAREATLRPPVLIVVPRSIVFNWMSEARRFAPALRVIEHGGHRRANGAEQFDGSDLILTTYGILRNDIIWLRQLMFDWVILDEAQAIKNPRSATAKAARLLPARRRLVLTGTPVENHLGDLWSIFEFINPGMLGTFAGFRRLFMDQRRSAGEANEEGEAAKLLAKLVRPFVLRRTKAEVAPELPDRIEQILYCELAPPERARYNELLDYYRNALSRTVDPAQAGERGDDEQIVLLEALLRLRQAACHPGLLDRARRGGRSAKIEMLVARLQAVLAEGRKVLVFSQFVRLLSILRTRLEEQALDYEYLDGKTENRGERIFRFQTDPACRLFLISLKAGGVGLNLTAAEYVFILDPWWNPAVEAQAIDRTHRIGQNRTVFAYRLIARDTVEERVLELQERKRELARSVIGGRDSGGLTREDLLFLLGER